MSETPPRPSHTTLAAGLIIGGSVGVVIGVADQLSGLHSLETREAIAGFLSEPPGSGLGLEVSTTLAGLRLALMVVAGSATAAAVLGYHVLKGSHRARVGVSVLALPIFVGGLATGGFLTSLVAAASLLLWIGPSGAWFRGEQVPPRPTPRDRAARRSIGGTDAAGPAWPPQPPQQPEGSGPPEGSEPPPGPESPESPEPTGTGRPAPATTYPPAPSTAQLPDGRSRRPDALVWACVLTWALSSIALVVLVASSVLLASDPGLVLDELRRQGREVPDADLELLRATTYATAGVLGVWTLGAVAVAAAAYRGVGWARVALVVSAVGAAVLCLLAAVSTLFALVPCAVCLATVVLLTRPHVRAWFTRA